MYTVLVISIIIVLVILLLSVVTTSKAYQYKHTIDPVDQHPENKETEEDAKKDLNQP